MSRRATIGVAVAGALAAGAGTGVWAGKPPPPPPPPVTATVQFAPSTPTSISEAGGALSVTLQRNTTGIPGSKVLVQTFDGTATAPSDYTAQNFVAEIPASSSKMTFVIPIVNDTIAEKTETFVVKITPVATSDPEYAQVDKKKNSLTVSIIDNDPCPALSVNNASATEGSAMTFTVSRASTCALPSQVNWSVADNTPTPDATGGPSNVYPADYNNTQHGTVVLATGVTSATFNVTSNQDTVDEPDQTFRVLLSSPINASIANGTGVATILDDDAPVVATIGSDQTVWAGDTAHFAVNLSAASEWTVVVTVMTDDTDDPPGSVVSDAPGTAVTFTPGATTEPYDVSTLPTSTAALNALDWVEIASAQHATFSDPAVVDCGPGCTTDSWGRLHVKNTVPFQTTVVTDPSGTVTQGTLVTETATVTNESGDPLPGVAVRGELWRDATDASTDSGEADGNLFATGSVVTDANGQVFGGPYTDTDGFDVADWLFVCVPGYDGATASSCGVDGGSEGDGEEVLSTPAPPSTIGWTSVYWTP